MVFLVLGVMPELPESPSSLRSGLVVCVEMLVTVSLEPSSWVLVTMSVDVDTTMLLVLVVFSSFSSLLEVLVVSELSDVLLLSGGAVVDSTSPDELCVGSAELEGSGALVDEDSSGGGAEEEVSSGGGADEDSAGAELVSLAGGGAAELAVEAGPPPGVEGGSACLRIIARAPRLGSLFSSHHDPWTTQRTATARTMRWKRRVANIFVGFGIDC
jgi:hypothetical protein